MRRLAYTTRFRRARMRHFGELFSVDRSTSVIDVGGTALNWELLDVAPSVTLVNIATPDPHEVLPPHIRRVQGDGRSLAYPDGAFDVAFSNSTIEHLGSYEQQEAFARELRRVARGVYVQTPARSFPFEPHWYGIGIHWLPRAAQRRLARWCTLFGLVHRPGPETVGQLVDEYRLLTLREMRRLFPDCDIHRERLAGLTKAYVAVRRAA